MDSAAESGDPCAKGKIVMARAQRDDEDDRELLRLEWQAWYAEYFLTRDTESGVEVIRGLAESEARAGRRPPTRNPKRVDNATTKAGGNTPREDATWSADKAQQPETEEGGGGGGGGNSEIDRMLQEDAEALAARRARKARG